MGNLTPKEKAAVARMIIQIERLRDVVARMDATQRVDGILLDNIDDFNIEDIVAHSLDEWLREIDGKIFDLKSLIGPDLVCDHADPEGLCHGCIHCLSHKKQVTCPGINQFCNQTDNVMVICQPVPEK